MSDNGHLSQEGCDARMSRLKRQIETRTPEEIETSIRVGILNGQGLIPVLANFVVKTAMEVVAKIDGLSPGIARQLRTDIEQALLRALKQPLDELPPDDDGKSEEE